MADIGFSQIQDQLNGLFSKSSDHRELIFWYDKEANFFDDVQQLTLNNAEVFILREHHSLMDKEVVELEKPNTNFLLYAPFQRPDRFEDHFYAMTFYSKEFVADKAAMTALSLGISPKLNRVIERHRNFFDNKDRTQRFKDLLTDSNSAEGIEIAMMAVLSGIRAMKPSFDRVTAAVLAVGDELISEFDKFDLGTVFWDMVQKRFGYQSDAPTVRLLNLDLFAAALYLKTDEFFGKTFGPERAGDSRNADAQIFLSGLQHDDRTASTFSNLAHQAYRDLGGSNVFLKKLGIEGILNVGLFTEFDDIIIDWIVQQLLDKNVNAEIAGSDLTTIIKKKVNQKSNSGYASTYHMLKQALTILTSQIQRSNDDKHLIQKYVQESFKIDAAYRKFYTYLTNTIETPLLDRLKDLVDGQYNDFLEQSARSWSNEFNPSVLENEPRLEDFYSQNITKVKERTVVLISDAFRFEAAVSLSKYLEREQKMTTDLDYAITGLPSVTKFGMAELLPHDLINVDERYQVSVDGNSTVGTIARTNVLKRANVNDQAIQYKELETMSRDKLRQYFKGARVTYVYHNVIDAEGDKSITENEVLPHTTEAIDALMKIIYRIGSATQISRFIVTADHGFIYRRSPLTMADRIEVDKDKTDEINHRYILSSDAKNNLGITSFKLKDLMRTDSELFVNTPVGDKVISSAGGGQNYVHGGASLQEMVVPILHIHAFRGANEESSVEIALVSSFSKITTQIINIDFVQTMPISDTVKPSHFTFYFIDSNGDHISGESFWTANSKSDDVNERRFKLQFSFKSRQYNNRAYTLVVENERGRKVLTQDFYIDIPL